jgi:hypothetical protein
MTYRCKVDKTSVPLVCQPAEYMYLSDLRALKYLSKFRANLLSNPAHARLVRIWEPAVLLGFVHPPF